MRCSATTQSPGRHSFMSLACSRAACRISSVVSLSLALQAGRMGARAGEQGAGRLGQAPQQAGRPGNA